MTADPALLARLVDASRRVGAAQLDATGCVPAGMSPQPPAGCSEPARPALWLSGPVRAAAVLAAAADATLSTDAARLHPDVLTAVTELAGPAEVLAALGGDDRQVPVGGRNSYGLPLFDLDPSVRLSSCTATPPDRVTLGSVDRWRKGVLATVRTSGQAPSPRRLHAAIAGPIAGRLGLADEWRDRIVLAASGTDADTLVTVLATGVGERPLVNVTVGALEAGRGTRLAAAGQAFQTRSPFGLDGRPGTALAGLERRDIRVVDVDVRDAAGRPRRAFDVEAEIDAHLELALEQGARVVVHVLEASKTGLRQPTLEWVRRTRAAHPDVRVVVDSAQARATSSLTRAYLDAGAAVLLTGSKALGAPPFCGALLLDDGLLADAASLTELPSGLAAFTSQAELPPVLARLASTLPVANYGLLARWHAALDEWTSITAIPARTRELVATTLLDGLRSRLARLPAVDVLDEADVHRSIITFRVRHVAGGFRNLESLRSVYDAVVAHPGVHIGQPVELVANRMAALRFAVGAVTVSRLATSDRPIAAARAMADLAVERLAHALGASVPA